MLRGRKIWCSGRAGPWRWKRLLDSLGRGVVVISVDMTSETSALHSAKDIDAEQLGSALLSSEPSYAFFTWLNFSTSPQITKYVILGILSSLRCLCNCQIFIQYNQSYIWLFLRIGTLAEKEMKLRERNEGARAKVGLDRGKSYWRAWRKRR